MKGQCESSITAKTATWGGARLGGMAVERLGNVAFFVEMAVSSSIGAPVSRSRSLSRTHSKVDLKWDLKSDIQEKSNV